MIRQRTFKLLFDPIENTYEIRIGREQVRLCRSTGSRLFRIGRTIRLFLRKPEGRSTRFCLTFSDDLATTYCVGLRNPQNDYCVCRSWLLHILGCIPKDIYVKAVK